MGIAALGVLGVWNRSVPIPVPLVQAPCSSSPRLGGAGRAKHRSLSSLSRPRAPSRTLAPLWGRLPPGFGATAVPVWRHREPFPSLPVGTSCQILSLPSPGSWQPGICGEGGSRWGPSCQLMPQRGSARSPPHKAPLPGCSPARGSPSSCSCLSPPSLTQDRGRPHLSPAAAPGSGPVSPSRPAAAGMSFPWAQGAFVPAEGWRGGQSPLPILLHPQPGAGAGSSPPTKAAPR